MICKHFWDDMQTFLGQVVNFTPFNLNYKSVKTNDEGYLEYSRIVRNRKIDEIHY